MWPLKNLGQPARVALKGGSIALYSPAKLLSHQPVHGRGAYLVCRMKVGSALLVAAALIHARLMA